MPNAESRGTRLDARRKPWIWNEGVEQPDGAQRGRARERRRTLTGALTAKRPASAELVTADMIDAYGVSARWTVMKPSSKNATGCHSGTAHLWAGRAEPPDSPRPPLELGEFHSEIDRRAEHEPACANEMWGNRRSNLESQRAISRVGGRVGAKFVP